MRPILLTLAFVSLGGIALAAPGFPGSEAIQAQRARASVEHLASDALEGRGSGERGGKRAGQWLAKQLQTLGLRPAGTKGFFQPFKGQGKSLRNVLAQIPGSQPGEAIVIGAHYDHLGLGHQQGSLDFGRSRGKIHNGADDNASGTVGVLEIARAFQASKRQPKRTVIFAWFDGEERGLLGSKHWVSNPSVATKVVAMINLDMIGRLEGPLSVQGSVTGDLFPAWLKAANADLGLKLKLGDTISANSDHSAFYKAGVPVLVPFTGLHGDYHRPTDDAEYVNVVGLVKIARLCYGVASQAANAPRAPRFSKARSGGFEMLAEQLRAMLGGGRRRSRSEPASQPKPRLGVGMEDDGVTVRRVYDQSVASRAGVVAGDRILSVGGSEVANLDQLRAAVGKARGATELRVSRQGSSRALRADFGGSTRPKAQPVPEQGSRWF
jgi:hypothetical protein